MGWLSWVSRGLTRLRGLMGFMGLDRPAWVKGAELVSHVARGLRAALTAAAVATLAVGVLTSSAAARPSTARAGIAGTRPAWATGSARMSSQAVTSGTVSARVYLAGQDPAGLAAYAIASSTPGNARYGHYLTPAQVMARYGPTQAQVSAVTGWLTAAGLTMTKVDPAADFSFDFEDLSFKRERDCE